LWSKRWQRAIEAKLKKSADGLPSGRCGNGAQAVGDRQGRGKHQVEMVTISSTNGAEELAMHIEGIVSEHWGNTRKAMLMTNLGKIIRERHPELIEYIRPTLRRFIEESHAVSLITHQDFFQTQGVIPLQVNTPLNLRGFIW
jgi:hypothetical protein